MATVGYERIQSCGGEDIITLEKNERLGAEARTQPHLTSSKPGPLSGIRWAAGWRAIRAAVRTVTKWRPIAIGVSSADWEYAALVPGELQSDVWLLYLTARDRDGNGRSY